MNNYNDFCQDYIKTKMELEELLNGKMIQKGIDILNDEEYKTKRRGR